jgi:hypothetical protein
MIITSIGFTTAQEIDTQTIENIVSEIASQHPTCDTELLHRGIDQVAKLWNSQDGNNNEFAAFIKENYAPDAHSRKVLFNKLSKIYEILLGTSNQVAVELNIPTMLVGDELTAIDYMMSAFNPYSHLWDDLYNNKVAFITILNFPYYTLDEKNTLGTLWNREQWAYARMGDMFTSRVPATVNQAIGQAAADGENYIATYNIMMGNLLNEKGKRLFPEDMILLSHWNLRDEIKSNYAPQPNAHEKQEMIYRVMQHIVNGTIPQEVINNNNYDWAPYSNRTWQNGEAIVLNEEGTRRYEIILSHFEAMKKADLYEKQAPTGIIRNFDGAMEISTQEIEELFINVISSQQSKM